MKLEGVIFDRTIKVVDQVLEDTYVDQQRTYLGMSIMGHPCARRLWYEHRGLATEKMTAVSIRRIEDGHRGESVMAERLQAVPQIHLDRGPRDGEQYEVEAIEGHVRGHPDGIIVGLVEAPQTRHVWEHKCVAEKKVSDLMKKRLEMDEQEVLRAWDETYFWQAQGYMVTTGIDRHFLTCSSPGERMTVSLRTKVRKRDTKARFRYVKDVISGNEPPPRISESAAWWQCKICKAHAICHRGQLPPVHCRSCVHVKPDIDQGGWYCNADNTQSFRIPVDVLRVGCGLHLYQPVLVSWAKQVDRDLAHNTVTYELPDGQRFVNGHPDQGHIPSRYLQGMVPELVTDEALVDFAKEFKGSSMDPQPALDSAQQSVDHPPAAISGEPTEGVPANGS